MLPLKVLIVGAWFAALAVAERLVPAAPRPKIGGRLLRNLGLWIANTAINPFITVPITVAAASVSLWARPSMPFGLGLALDLLVLDLWAYAWHRANHEWRFLWRFHRIHHLDEFLDTTSAVRFHPGEVVISALARAPLIVAADINLGSILVFDAIVLISALFHHSNLRLPHRLEATLRLVFVTPSHHWVHHHAVKRDTDSNYGALLTLWDRLFCTWSRSERTKDMTIGVEGLQDMALGRLAAAPFR